MWQSNCSGTGSQGLCRMHPQLPDQHHVHDTSLADAVHLWQMQCTDNHALQTNTEARRRTLVAVVPAGRVIVLRASPPCQWHAAGHVLEPFDSLLGPQATALQHAQPGQGQYSTSKAIPSLLGSHAPVQRRTKPRLRRSLAAAGHQQSARLTCQSTAAHNKTKAQQGTSRSSAAC